MVLISIKDYAKNHGISYEAVRQQLIRYREDLKDHVIKDGRQQYLDEEAVAFLDGRRQKNPVAVIFQDKDDMIDQLRAEKEKLLVMMAAKSEKIESLYGQLQELQAKQLQAAEERKLLDAEIATERQNFEDQIKQYQGEVEILQDRQKQQESENKALQDDIAERDDIIRQLEKELDTKNKYLNQSWIRRLFSKRPR